MDFCYDNAIGAQRNISHDFFPSIKSTRILTFINKVIINLLIYRTNLLSANANPDEKGCLPASKVIKESEKQFIVKNLLWSIVYSMTGIH